MASLAGITPELMDGSVQVELGQWTTAIAAEVLVNAKGGLAQMLAESVLEEFSVQPDQTDYVTAPFSSIATALQQGDAAATVLPEPFLTQAEEKLGVATLADLNQGGVTDFPLAGYVTSSAWVQKNPAVAEAFVEALVQGQVVASTDRKAVEQVLQRNLGMSGVVTSVIALGTYPIGINAVQLGRVGYLMQRLGILSPSASVSSLASEMIH